MITKWTYRENDTDQGVEYLGVDYGAMDFVLVNAIQELNNKLNASSCDNNAVANNQSAEIEQLKSEQIKLQEQINALQNLIQQLVAQQNNPH